MVRRLTSDWHPLRDSDPTPGVTEKIDAEAARMKQVATTIRDQIARLNKIADAANLKGDTPDQLRSKSRDMAGKLTKVADRYEKVSGYLSGWSKDLGPLQQKADQAALDAQDAQRRNDQNTTPVYDPKNTPSPTTQQQTDETARLNTLRRATDDLNDARGRMDSACNDRDHAGHKWMQLIEDTVHDGLKDSGWDSFKDWVDQNAGWLSTLADVLGWIATALAIVALFVSGGWLVVLLIAVTVAALAIHTTLALAGDGSWLAVGLDVLSLCFVFRGLAVAAKLGKAAEVAQAGLKDAAPELATMAQKAAYASTKAARSEAGRVFASKGMKGTAEWAAAQAKASAAMKQVLGAYQDTMNLANPFITETLPNFRSMGAVFSKQFLKSGVGEEDFTKFFSQAGDKFPTVVKMPESVATGLARNSGYNIASFAIDGANHALGGSTTPGIFGKSSYNWQGWGPWNSTTTWNFGTSW